MSLAVDSSGTSLPEAVLLAISTVATAFSAYFAWAAIRDARQSRSATERGDYYRRIVAHPVLDHIPAFTRTARALFVKARQAAKTRPPYLMPEQLLADQKDLAKQYHALVSELDDVVMNAVTAWGDSELTLAVESQLFRIEDVQVEVPALLTADGQDPRLPERIGMLTAQLTELIVKHNYNSDPKDARLKRLRHFFSS